jgi:Mg-chelatase subunit ChlD
MRKTGTDLISRSLPIVAAAYAKKFGIKIGIGGSEAFTDGNHIQLPSIPEDYPFKDALWGFLAHEASHVRFTDFDVESPNDYHHSLVNSIEDGRIEHEFIRVFPGSKETLDEALRLFVVQGHMEKPSGSEHPAQILSAYVLYWVRNQWRQQSILDDHFHAALRAMNETFPRDVVARLDRILSECPKLKGTSDVSNMVDRILKLFESDDCSEQPEDKQPENGEQPDTGESEGEGEDDQNKGSSADKPDQQDQGNQNSDTSDGSQSASDKGQADAPEGQGGSGSDPKSSDDQSSSSGGAGSHGRGPNLEGEDASERGAPTESTSQSALPGKAGQEAEKKRNVQLVQEGTAEHGAQDVFDSIKAELQNVAKTNPNRHVMLPPEAVPAGSVQPAYASEIEGRARRTTIALRKQLMALVEANGKTQKRYLDQGHKVASNRLSGVPAGDFRVFRKEKRKKKVNTAVHILLDASGSMNRMVSGTVSMGTRIQVANEASLAIAQALEAIPRVSVAVTAFRGLPQDAVYEMLQHNQTASACAGRFSVVASGGTPLAPALWHAARDLCNRREERKIVMVITDGMPAQPEQTHHVLSLMERSGYEVVAIGIGQDAEAVSNFIKDHCVIQTASDLKRKLFDIFRRKLAA